MAGEMMRNGADKEAVGRFLKAAQDRTDGRISQLLDGRPITLSFPPVFP